VRLIAFLVWVNLAAFAMNVGWYTIGGRPDRMPLVWSFAIMVFGSYVFLEMWDARDPDNEGR
jgi:hypothetical protein